MGSSKLGLLLCLLHSIAATLPAAVQLDLLWSHQCIDDYGNYTSNSTFKSNLDELLTKISITDISYGFYNFSAGKDPDQAYVIALCRGDVDVADCHTCINFVESNLTNLFPNQKEFTGWADNCMLRYSSRDILGGEWEMYPGFALISGTNVTDVDHFTNVLQSLLESRPSPGQVQDGRSHGTSDFMELHLTHFVWHSDSEIHWTVVLESLPNRTASGDSRLKFATGETNVTADQKVYALTQCTPDLSTFDCLGCLSWAI